MKNFFGFCEDRKETDGAPFIIRSVGEKLQKDKDGNAAALEKIRRKSTLPVWLSVVKWILLFFFVIVLISTLRAGPRTAWHNAPGLLIAAGASVILWLALFLYGKYRGRNAKTAEAQQAMTASQRTEDESEKQLLIPEYAMPTDVLAFSYYTKKGKPRRRGTLMAEYILFETQMFREGDMLCFTDLTDVYGIPVSEITAITQRKKRVSATGWNKLAQPDDPAFKPYRIAFNNYGVLFMPPCAVTIRRGEEEYELLLAPYEAEKVCGLCGIPLTEETKEEKN